MPKPSHDKRPNREPLPAGVESRMVALRLLHMVVAKQRTVEQAWEQEERALMGLDGSDIGFVRVLLMATLRHLGQVDALLAELVEKPLPSRALPVMDMLRLGIVQLLWLDVPPHAAVHSAVEVIRALKQPNYCALSNAVLQRVTREMPEWKAKAEAQPEANMPIWMRARLHSAYGQETLHALLRAHAEFGTTNPAYTDLSFRDEKERDVLLPHLPEGSVLLPNGSVRVMETGRPELWDGFDEGQWWVQDAAASMPAQLLLNALDKQDASILDACAAPGGKTAQLLAAGHRVDALDLSESRQRRLKENLDRLGYRAQRLVGDASEYEPEEKYDAVLLDAPCSATGTIRRHPELPYQRSAADVARLCQLQQRMLDHAHHWLKPGGVMVYAVCSLLPEEGEEAILEFLGRNSQWQMQPVTDDELNALGLTAAQRTANGALRLLPNDWANKGGLDGFYIARLVLR